MRFYLFFCRFLAITAIVFLLSGCKQWRTITVEKPVYIHDTTQTVKEVHDSTFIDRWNTVLQKGDTVYVTEKQKTVKYRTITDTAYKYVEKPVTVTVSQIKEVEKPLTKWQKFQMRGFWFFVLLSEISILIFVCSKKMKNLSKK